MNMRKTALVTGANSGMGKATARAFADMDMDVIMLCRSKERGTEALKEVRSQTTGTGSLRLMLCDLADLNNIKRFCDSFRQEYDALDILVNNAGVITLDRRETADGLELQFGVNHIGHFFLTTELLPLFTNGGRIVNVGSGAHKIGTIKFNNLGMEKNYTVFTAYGRAKLCNLLFTRELARRTREKGLLVNCVHPGAVATNMGVDRDTGFGRTIMKLLKPVFLTPEEGAATAIFAATSPDIMNITGEYLYRKELAPSSRLSKDMHLAYDLWRMSEKIVRDFR